LSLGWDRNPSNFAPLLYTQTSVESPAKDLLP